MAGDFSAFLLEYECEMCVDVPGLVLYLLHTISNPGHSYICIRMTRGPICMYLHGLCCHSLMLAKYEHSSLFTDSQQITVAVQPCSRPSVFFPTTPCESSVAGVSVTGHLTVISSSDPPPCMIHGEVVWSCDFQCVYTYNYVYRCTCMLRELNVYDECCVSNLMSL